MEEKKTVTFDYEMLIRNLKVFSSLESSDRIYISDSGDISIEESYFPSVVRYRFGQSREATIKYAEILFAESCNYLNKIELCKADDERINQYISLLLSTSNGLKGIAAIKRTYAGDRTAESHLTRIETKTNTDLHTIMRNLIVKGYFHNKRD